ncbi:MAG TPA: orotidine-5'-phosphate decarboxylase [Bauldia sp.]|nr:orotidine-5'-phosphate decarboxylase [Bauldia sp.]
MPIPARERLIVALDVPTVAEAEAMVARLGDSVVFYKVGLQLVFAGGLAFAERLARSGKKVFLDVKLLDIGNTVAGAIDSIARMGMTYVTVHAYPQALRAAVKARGSASLKLLAVTVLTSMNERDLSDAGYRGPISSVVALRAADARTAGIDGIVASPAEAAAVRTIVGPGMVIVTPGIRPSGSDAADQKRTATPAEAIHAGADYLVVGRPVTAAADPKAAAESIVAEIEAASA